MERAISRGTLVGVESPFRALRQAWPKETIRGAIERPDQTNLRAGCNHSLLQAGDDLRAAKMAGRII
jgi:hypothetical protein